METDFIVSSCGCRSTNSSLIVPGFLSGQLTLLHILTVHVHEGPGYGLEIDNSREEDVLVYMEVPFVAPNVRRWGVVWQAGAMQPYESHKWRVGG